MDRRADSANEHGDQFLIAEVEKIAMKIETRMPLLDGMRFDVNLPVTGAEAVDVVNRLQALLR